MSALHGTTHRLLELELCLESLDRIPQLDAFHLPLRSESGAEERRDAEWLIADERGCTLLSQHDYQSYEPPRPLSHRSPSVCRQNSPAVLKTAAAHLLIALIAQVDSVLLPRAEQVNLEALDLGGKVLDHRDLGDLLVELGAVANVLGSVCIVQSADGFFL